MLARAYEACGKPDVALSYLNSYPDVVEDNVTALTGDRFSVAETQRQIDELEYHRDRECLNSKIRFSTLVVLFILIAGLLARMAYRRMRKLRQEKEMRQQELEKAKRAELSMTLYVREKERLISELRQKVSRMADDERIDTDAAREIESSIRSEEGASKADEEFGKVFATISPDFRKRLRERYPRIGRNTMRMAEYIAIGMDNRHIARVMNIRLESVKQNRWRLRQAFGLEPNENLDEILRQML